MDSLDRLIPNSLRKAGASNQVKAAMILELVRTRLREHFGDDLAIMMKPTTLRNGVSTIRCTNSSCAQDIVLNERELLEKINATLDNGDAVTRLRATN